MKKLVTLFIFSLTSIFFSIADEHQPLTSQIVYPSFANVVEPLIPTVVNIYTEQSLDKNLRSGPSPFGDLNEFFFRNFDTPFPFEDIYSNPRATSLGSGFIIDKAGYIVTNYHVVENGEKIKVKLYDETEFEAKIIGTDKKTDLALLKIEAKQELPFALLGNDKNARVGDWVIAIGNPFGLSHTVTAGIISSKARDIDLDQQGIVNNYIQTDAPINRGNSGGPLFTLDGQVVGVNTSIYSTSGANAGVGFAIPAQTVRKVIEQLKNFGKVSRGFLNIQIASINPEMAQDLGLNKDQKGVLVNEVHYGGDGERAGLHPGDVIVRLQGKKISSARELQVMVAELEPNSTINISIIRNSKPIELTGTIASDTTSIADSQQVIVKRPLTDADIEINHVIFTNFNPQEAAKHDLSNKIVGVLVKHVDKKSAWFKYIKAGDVVVNVNYEDITDVKSLQKAYLEGRDKKNVVFVIKRRNSSLFLSLPFVAM